MKTFNFGERANKGELEPSVAGALSLVPGLGQFYNGDSLKGWLFLEVGAINFMILMLILCADSLSTGLAQFAVNHHFNANYALLKQLAQFKLGHPGATLLFTLCLAFIAFSVRDAYDRATNIKRREIYAGHFLELSEATSGSYLAHFALMGALLMLSVFLLIPAPPRQQVTEIEFVSQTPERHTKNPEIKRVSANEARPQGMHKKELPVRTRQGQTTPTQASASRSEQQSTSAAKPQVKPEVKTQQADAPKPAPVKIAEAPKPPAVTTAPLPVVRPPAPTPIAFRPAPAPPAPTTVAPKPLPATPSSSLNLFRPNSAPVAAGTASFTPKPLLAYHPVASSAFATPSVEALSSGLGANHPSKSHSWMNGKTSANGKAGSGPSAPSVDTSSFNGTGTSNSKPTLADTSAGRTGPGKGHSNLEGPKPMGAKTGPAPGDILAVLPKLTTPVGDLNGGRGNPDPNKFEKGREQVGTGNPTPNFDAYLANLQRRIRRAWMPPRQPNSRSSIVTFTVGLNGELLGLHLARSSGEAAMDEAAIQSIKNSAPFQHLPPNSPDSVDVQFTFDYNVFGAGGRHF